MAFPLLKRRKKIKILVAVDSIIYAPLYAFVEWNSSRLHSDSKFLFQVEPVQHSIRLKRPHDLRGLAPITYDPVFSPVTEHGNNFVENPSTWFGIGDPLRVVRLGYDNNDFFSFNFIGTLVSKMAYWIVAERRVEFKENQTHRYNYVTCHPQGMTGYYMAEFLFRTLHNNPLAPMRKPNQEIDHLRHLLQVDGQRGFDKDIDPKEREKDPVWIAAISMEIGKVLNFVGNNLADYNYQRVYKVFPTKVPENYLMTAIVARRDDANQTEINEASDELRRGLIEIINWFHEPKYHRRLIRQLKKFYRTHASFALPSKDNLFRIGQRMPNIIKELKDFYPRDLRAVESAKAETDKLLKSAIKSELGLAETADDTPEVLRYYEKLKTDNWGDSKSALLETPSVGHPDASDQSNTGTHMIVPVSVQ